MISEAHVEQKSSSCKNPEKFPWRLSGGIVTCLYVVIVILAVYQDEKGFLTRVNVLKLNELGDALAGFFAPLAFLWLFVATMIQGQELKDNRLVMRDQAQAAADQAEAAASQVKFLEEQTKAMQAQNDLAQEIAAANYQLQLYDKRTDLSRRLYKIGWAIIKDGRITEETRQDLSEASVASKWFFDDEIQTWLERLTSQARDACRKSRQADRLIKIKEKREWSDEEKGSYPGLMADIDTINEKLEDELEPYKIDAKLRRFLQLPASIEGKNRHVQ